MKIIWGKWVLQQLPEVLRTTLIYTFCMIFISPVRGMYTEFSTWKNKQRIKAGGSPQVCMLKKVVFDELGINVEIEEKDGKPYDFIIKAAFSNIDKERQLFALMYRYKLAGKSYTYENSSVSFSLEWNNYVCEKVVATVNNKWTAFVCEKRTVHPGTVTLTMSYHYKYEAEYKANIMKRVTIVADKVIESDLVIAADMYLFGLDQFITAEFKMQKGQTSFEIDTWVMDRHKNEKVTPTYDKYYEYKLIVKDIYE